ncbi:hypothetical protein SKAU_G00357690 [Synaphobranchus kaupii]|uniref:Uncharacterized protein n=1 Tax=Synaphobranchus kaupii TaxID=118154 RepID=A0A9Q1IEM7_SYNKA|nr:hypothetical protein SKAU_G00357690 [Synaphobranchus kaupii]
MSAGTSGRPAARAMLMRLSRYAAHSSGRIYVASFESSNSRTYLFQYDPSHPHISGWTQFASNQRRSKKSLNKCARINVRAPDASDRESSCFIFVLIPHERLKILYNRFSHQPPMLSFAQGQDGKRSHTPPSKPKLFGTAPNVSTCAAEKIMTRPAAQPLSLLLGRGCSALLHRTAGRLWGVWDKATLPEKRKKKNQQDYVRRDLQSEANTLHGTRSAGLVRLKFGEPRKLSSESAVLELNSLTSFHLLRARERCIPD